MLDGGRNLPPSIMRLNRFLSACGLGSRRGCEAIILEGRVAINGDICVNLATSVKETDEVKVDGRKLRQNKGVMIALHKPRGFVCTRRDERDRETLYNLLPEKFATLHHVGRLDKDSEGLILLTNQGELSQKLLHPSMGVEKEYEVQVEERFDPEKLPRLVEGFHTPEGPMKAERAWMIGDYKLGIVLKQGLKRQIRQMLYFLGFEVRRLIRVRIGNLSIKGLREGAWRELSADEVETLLLNPKSSERPKLSRPRTAAVKRHAAKRTLRQAPAKKRSRGPSQRRDKPPGSENNSRSEPGKGPRPNRDRSGPPDRPNKRGGPRGPRRPPA